MVFAPRRFPQIVPYHHRVRLFECFLTLFPDPDCFGPSIVQFLQRKPLVLQRRTLVLVGEFQMSSGPSGSPDSFVFIDIHDALTSRRTTTVGRSGSSTGIIECHGWSRHGTGMIAQGHTKFVYLQSGKTHRPIRQDSCFGGGSSVSFGPQD